MTSLLRGTIRIVRATPDDAPALAALASSTFVDTFGPDNRPEDMAAYVAQAFGEPLQRAELLDPRVTVLFAEREGERVGYAMLREGEAPACVASTSALYIARLYAVRDAIGSGVGAALIDACIGEARARGRDTIWLGVWERNLRAIAFYERWGFRDVGTTHFQLGADRQTDRVMARRVRDGA